MESVARNTTYRDEQFGRLFVGMFGASAFPALAMEIPEIAPFNTLEFALLTMTLGGLLLSLLGPSVWKFWKTFLLTIVAANLAVCAAWVYVKGIPSVPKELWPVFAFVICFIAEACIWGAVVFRVLERNTVVTGQSWRLLWEALLPVSVGGGALLALEGNWRVGMLLVLTLMIGQMLWFPTWKTSEIQTCFHD